MNAELIAVFLQVGGKITSDLLRLRPVKIQQEPRQDSAVISATPQAAPQETAEDTGEEKIVKGTACLPCTNSHLHACAGLLDEAYRMSPDGLNGETIVRVDKCLREIAAAERVDLAPENIASLPADERKIAEGAAKGMREIRHGLDGLSSKEQLEALAIQTSDLQKWVSGSYFKVRMAKMDPEQKAELLKKTLAKIEEE